MSTDVVRVLNEEYHRSIETGDGKSKIVRIYLVVENKVLTFEGDSGYNAHDLLKWNNRITDFKHMDNLIDSSFVPSCH